MKGEKALRVLDVHGLARFVIEHHFVLRAVILEHAADILHAREPVEERQKNGHADHAIGHVERMRPASAGKPSPAW